MERTGRNKIEESGSSLRSKRETRGRKKERKQEFVMNNRSRRKKRTLGQTRETQVTRDKNRNRNKVCSEDDWEKTLLLPLVTKMKKDREFPSQLTSCCSSGILISSSWNLTNPVLAVDPLEGVKKLNLWFWVKSVKWQFWWQKECVSPRNEWRRPWSWVSSLIKFSSKVHL